MSNNYRRRIITYDDNSQLYTITVPELGIELTSDTEASCLSLAREAVEEYVKSRSKLNDSLDKLNGMYDHTCNID